MLGSERQRIKWRTHQGKQGYLFAPAPGWVIVDGIKAFRAAVWSFPSFSLESVSQAPQFVMERAHTTGLAADHFGGSIAAFSHHYLPRMHRLGYVAPSAGEIQRKAYPGGYVMDSKPRFYDSVVVLDCKSLYPSIIRTFCMDPVSYAEGQHAGDASNPIKGSMGTFFSLWRSRDEAKKVKNEPLSQALKLLMNSFAVRSSTVTRTPSSSGWDAPTPTMKRMPLR